jgi:hypothetical protein
MTRQTTIVAGAGIVGALLLLFRRPPVASVTTSETFDLSPFGGPTNYTPKIQNFASAIARQEGFYVAGSIPQRANNPGDLKVPGLPTLPGTSITKFASADLGWAALHRQLQLIVTGQSSFYSLDMTIAEMARTWTTTEQTPWAQNVAMFAGVTVQTPLYEVLV